MFIIKVNGKRHIWSNKKADDFLQFLPKFFKCEPSAIEAYFVPLENEALVTPDSIDSLSLSQVGNKITAWPYTEAGAFTGNVCAGDV